MTESDRRVFISLALWASAFISCGTFLVGLFNSAEPRVSATAFVWAAISLLGLGSWIDFSGSKGRK